MVIKRTPKEVSKRVMAEKDADVLKDWLNAASRAGDIEQLRRECGI